MTEDLQQPRKSHRKLWLVVGIVIGVIVICGGIFALMAGKVAVEKAPIESVLDSFMKCMVAKDVESAYALFSRSAQRQFPISDLQKLIEGNNYALFEGYQSLSVQGIEVTVSTNSGTVATVSGTTRYDDGFQGTFNGDLEKVNGKWRLVGIHITVPPDKFQP